VEQPRLSRRSALTEREHAEALAGGELAGEHARPTRRRPFVRRLGPLAFAAAGAALVVLGRGAGPSWERWALWLALGIVGGAVLLPISTALVGGSAAAALRGLVRAPETLAKMRLAPLMVGHYLAVSAGEELFYRMGLQGALLRDTLPALLGVAALFTCIHQLGKREIVIVNVLELFAFACILGWAYAATHSLTLVIAVHAVRDIGIVLAGETSA